MASVLKVDELKGNSTAGIIAVTGEEQLDYNEFATGSSKAWAECNSAGTSINDSFNIASLVVKHRPTNL